MTEQQAPPIEGFFLKFGDLVALACVLSDSG